MAKMSNKMIALCSAAIGAVYMSGYVTTESAQAANNQQQTTALGKAAVGKHFKYHHVSPSKRLHKENSSSGGKQVTANQSTNKNTQHASSTSTKQSSTTSVKASSSHNTKTNTNTTTKSNQTATKTQTQKTTKKAPAKPQNKLYKDGTYTGVGSAWNGSVQVAVTTKSDKITSVRITRCTTSYSESYISGLPKEVLQRQSANVDVVSGATYSTEDFKSAVQQALQKAKI